MAFSLGSIFKKGVTAAATWAGGVIGGPTGAKIGGALAGSTGVAKNLDGKDLNYEWERRLMNAMSKDAEYKKTLT